MNRKRNILKYKQTVGVCFGIIAAIVILVSQSFYYDYLVSASSHTKATTEAGDDGGNHGPDILTISKDAVTSVVQYTITHALHFIAEIYLDNSDEIEIELDQKVDVSTYFKTLFRLIISPNAP